VWISANDSLVLAARWRRQGLRPLVINFINYSHFNLIIPSVIIINCYLLFYWEKVIFIVLHSSNLCNHWYAMYLVLISFIAFNFFYGHFFFGQINFIRIIDSILFKYTFNYSICIYLMWIHYYIKFSFCNQFYVIIK